MIMIIIAGFLSGVTASMGLGGGFILLIYLTVIQNMNQLQAQGINLLFFLPIAILSIIIHKKNDLIDKRPLLPTISFGILGVGVGILFAFFVPTYLLSKLFAILVLFVGIKELFHKKKR